MQWLIFCIFLAWTILFGMFFVMLFPESSDRVQQLFYYSDQNEDDSSGTLADAEYSIPIPKPTQSPPAKEEEEFVPIEGGKLPPIHLDIKGEKELPKSQDEINKEMDLRTQVALENRLIKILVKINIAACKTCSRDDKRIILQLKMMQAFLEGKPKLALKYSEELSKYVKTRKGAWIGDKPGSEGDSKIPNNQN